MISVHFQGKPFNITVIQVYALTRCWRNWSWMVLWRPTRPSRTNTPKDVLFIIGGLNAKVGSLEIPGVTGKFGLGVQNEAGLTVLPRVCIGHRSTIFQQHKRRLYTWTSPDGQHRNQVMIIFFAVKMEKLYTVSKNSTGSWQWLRSWTPYCQIQT